MVEWIYLSHAYIKKDNIIEKNSSFKLQINLFMFIYDSIKYVMNFSDFIIIIFLKYSELYNYEEKFISFQIWKCYYNIFYNKFYKFRFFYL